MYRSVPLHQTAFTCSTSIRPYYLRTTTQHSAAAAPCLPQPPLARPLRQRCRQHNAGQRSRTGGLSVSLDAPDGRLVGGGVDRLLIAASPVQNICLIGLMPATYSPTESSDRLIKMKLYSELGSRT
ncbi:hypothetical protein GUJ93_ZPchr0010g9434 [Zizania palustris]|uniref:AT-hook motif nuclear-localized protein n=1 Tax=Zizania palustris TaxID=103762 RepID=A0A8J5WHC8_ZIZPA|nr:hypothetical protein GUJ93_ZPchr0010g9434 [Zizania palustris]